MTAEAVYSEIVKPMQGLFLPPKNHSDPEIAELLHHYVAALKDFEGMDLQESWKAVRDSYVKTSWPAIALFVKAAIAAKTKRIGTPRQRSYERFGRPDWSTLWAMWQGARVTDEAAKAVEMKVAWSFKCAVLHDAKGVKQISLVELASANRKAAELADKLRRGIEEPKLADVDAGTMLRIWEQMCVNEEETQREILDARRGRLAQEPPPPDPTVVEEPGLFEGAPA